MTDLTPLRCPASAPEKGMSGAVVANAGEPPRRFIACSVTPLLTCSTAADQPTSQPGTPTPPGSYFPVDYCAPIESGYAHCILKPGNQDCSETDYHVSLLVSDETGAPATICCRQEDASGPA
jgi:hypothetical protein